MNLSDDPYLGHSFTTAGFEDDATCDACGIGMMTYKANPKQCPQAARIPVNPIREALLDAAETIDWQRRADLVGKPSLWEGVIDLMVANVESLLQSCIQTAVEKFATKVRSEVIGEDVIPNMHPGLLQTNQDAQNRLRKIQRARLDQLLQERKAKQ